MSSILVSVMPFAGHVAPVSSVVAELLSRGHEVTVYTGSRYLERFSSVGAQVLPWTRAPDFDEYDLPATFPQVGKRGPLGLLANLEHIFIRSGVGQAQDIAAAHAVAPFDLIVSDVMSIGGSLASELTGVPWTTLSIVPLSQGSVDLPPSGLALHPATTAVGRWRDSVLRRVFAAASAPLERALRQTRARLGLPPSGVRFENALYSPTLVAVTGSPSLEYPRSDLGSQFHFVGRLKAPVRGQQDEPDWWPELLATTKPVVLVTQGTFNVDPNDLIVPALTALASENVFVIATTLGHELPIPVPANARLASYVPFDKLLPRVDVAITNGGWGGVLEALSHGIPLIVAGGDLDKPEIAARVSWAGVGIDLRTGHPTSTQVSEAYGRIDQHRERAQDVAAELNGLGGAAAACSLIETLL